MLQKKFDPLYPILNSIDQDSIIVNTTNTLDTIFIAGSGGKYGIPKYSPAFTDEKTRADYFLNLLKK
jgi:hypothetical protein